MEEQEVVKNDENQDLIQRPMEKNLTVQTIPVIETSISGSLSQYNKTDMFDDLNGHEDEIRKMLYEYSLY